MSESDLSVATGPGSFQTHAERRQITVLFCDLVDSTALSSQLDPEDLRDVLLHFQEACRACIERHSGFIARYMGDGILVYFGYPAGHEEAPCRSVRAGLDIVRAIPVLRTSAGIPIAVRVAVATGLSVVGDVIGSGTASEIGVTGKVANLAARILAVVNPNAMAVSDETYQLVSGSFDFGNPERRKFKGIEGEVKVWPVLGERADPIRYGMRTKPRFFGRTEELQALLGMWMNASNGDYRIALVRGEAGIGKTALLRQFELELGNQPYTRVLLQCSSQHMGSPLYPLIMHLRRAAMIESTDSSLEKLDKIESMIPPANASGWLPLLASLLSVRCARHPLPVMPASVQKAQTLQLISDYTKLLATQQPVLLLVEDAHWIDHTSAELAALLAAALHGSRILVIIAARPEYWPAWGNESHVTPLNLSPLDDGQIRQLVQFVPEGAALVPAVTERLVERACGIPLFAQELALTMAQSLRSGTPLKIAEQRIPETLQDSLIARLDRLGSDKLVAQTAAVLGRKFTADMLEHMDNGFADELRLHLDRLVLSGLLIDHGNDARREYSFSHALMQEAAYESLLRSQRRQLHLQFAQMLIKHHQDLVETEPETLARHWTRGERAPDAVPLWLHAGQRSAARASNVEAITHVTEGIALLPLLPQSPQRDTFDFHLHLVLGQASYVVDGPAAESTRSAYGRAQSLLEHVGDATQRYTVLYGIFSSYHFASRFELALEPATRALVLATRENDDGHLCQAHRMLGYISFFTGDTAAARNHFRILTSLYRPEHHGQLAARYGADCRVGAHGFLCLIECLGGNPEGAVEMCVSNLAYAQSLGHPASIGWAYASAGYLYYFLGDALSAAKVTADGMHYCNKNKVASWLAHCSAFNFWAESSLSPNPRWASNLRRIIAEAAAGNSLGLPLLRSVLAEVLLSDGQAPEALSEIDVALLEMRASTQHVFEPSLHLVRGRCLMVHGQSRHQAAASFEAAIEASRRTHASLLEGRAVDLLAAVRQT